MRDFIVGLCTIVLSVLLCMVVGIVLCSSLIDLAPSDNNLFVKTVIGFFGVIGSFVLVMLSVSIGAGLRKEED